LRREGVELSGRGVDFSGRGIRVQLAPRELPELEIGDRFRLELEIEGHVYPPLTASLRFFEMAAEGVLDCGFLLLNPEVLEARGNESLWSLFNRRAALRVPASEAFAACVHRSPPAVAQPLEGRVRELSEMGIGIVLEDAAPEEEWSPGANVVLSIELPGASEAVRLPGVVRHCRREDRAAHLGVEFLDDGDEQVAIRRQLIAEYVAEQQSALMDRLSP
jgi:hypothetical protein